MAVEEPINTDEVTLCKESLQCYALLVGFEEATLGFGISLGFNGSVLVNARSPFEFLSYEAFAGLPSHTANTQMTKGIWICNMCTATNSILVPNCLSCRAAQPTDKAHLLTDPRRLNLGVRQNSCNTERFTHFLPLYLSEDHFKPELCARCLQAAWCRILAEQVPETIDRRHVQEATWNVLPALMNSTAVALVSGELHTSDVALRGYYNLHRLLLAMATPELRERAVTVMDGFMKVSEKRLKTSCPNLGHLIPRLLLLDEPLSAWLGIQEVLLRETLDRTALHAYREFPSLASEVDDAVFVKLWWASAAKGLRMLLFSIRFLKRAARLGSPGDIAAYYDQRFGQASSAEQNVFREDVFAVKAVNSWEAFAHHWCQDTSFKLQNDECLPCGDSLVSRLGSKDLSVLRRVLRESEENSLSKGYHTKAMYRSRRVKLIVAIASVVVLGLAMVVFKMTSYTT